jgi:replicative superfamily II helicase
MEIGEPSAWGASPALMKILSGTGIEDLYPPQILALQGGLLTTSDSLVTAASTAAGKTLIAEMAALKTFLETRGRCIYLVPLRALAHRGGIVFSVNPVEPGIHSLRYVSG